MMCMHAELARTRFFIIHAKKLPCNACHSLRLTLAKAKVTAPMTRKTAPGMKKDHRQAVNMLTPARAMPAAMAGMRIAVAPPPMLPLKRGI